MKSAFVLLKNEEKTVKIIIKYKDLDPTLLQIILAVCFKLVEAASDF